MLENDAKGEIIVRGGLFVFSNGTRYFPYIGTEMLIP